MGMPSRDIEYDSWRIRSDTNTPDGGTPTWETTEDQAAGLSWGLDTTFRLRVVMSHVGASDTAGDITLQYRIDGGTWTAIGGTTADAPVRADTSASTVSDGQNIATSNFVLATGTGTANIGEYWESVGGTHTNAFDNGEYTEVEWGLVLYGSATSPVTDGQSVEFRPVAAAADSEVYNYTNIPEITASVPNSGDLAYTEPSDTAAFSGDVLIAGDWTSTEAADTGSFAGDVLISGDWTSTEASDTFAATGTVADPANTGDLAYTEPADTASFSGDVIVAGDFIATEPADTGSFSGDVLIAGDLNATEAADTLASTGSVAISGDLAWTEAVDTAAFNGTVGNPDINGDLAYTEVADTAAFTGEAVNFMVLSATEPLDTLVFSGDVLVNGDINVTEPVDTLSITGSVAITATLDTTEAQDTLAMAVSNVEGAGDDGVAGKILMTRRRIG